MWAVLFPSDTAPELLRSGGMGAAAKRVGRGGSQDQRAAAGREDTQVTSAPGRRRLPRWKEAGRFSAVCSLIC